MVTKKIIARIKSLGIPELTCVEELNELNGDYINMESVLSNGETGKILDDNKKYWAAQVEVPWSEK